MLFLLYRYSEINFMQLNQKSVTIENRVVSLQILLLSSLMLFFCVLSDSSYVVLKEISNGGIGRPPSSSPTPSYMSG